MGYGRKNKKERRAGRRREIKIALDVEDEEDGRGRGRVVVGVVVVVPVHPEGGSVLLWSCKGLFGFLARVNKNKANRIIVFMYFFSPVYS